MFVEAICVHSWSGNPAITGQVEGRDWSAAHVRFAKSLAKLLHAVPATPRTPPPPNPARDHAKPTSAEPLHDDLPHLEIARLVELLLQNSMGQRAATESGGILDRTSERSIRRLRKSMSR